MVRVPDPGRLVELARSAFGLRLTEEEARSFAGLMEASIASYRRLDQLAEPELPVKYPRTGGYRPGPEENPLNAWYYRCSIKGAGEGPLAGKRVAIKDNVAVAGVSMMNGSSVLEGYVPAFDATIVTRILDAGGEISGKAVCEHLCFSGGSHTSDTGPVLNPHDHTRSAGGSSSGSAALVAAGEVEMAIGGDQGGSIRIPSCWCGTYGLKPTHGLVPYTGVFPIELTLDHVGPIAASVSDVALLLSAIAGEDGLDPRQRDVRVGDYPGALKGGVGGMRIGVVREGFGLPGLSEEDVDETVRKAAETFRELGVEVEEISIPLHRDGIHIWNAIAIEGATELMVRGNGMGTNWEGHYSTSLLDAYWRGRTALPGELSETVKLTMLTGQYMREAYGGRYYAKAQNLARTLRAAYDAALEEVDLLLMPTLPMKATPIPAPDAPREEVVARALEMIPNTAPFDVSGHPAMNVPCGASEGLPVGMMLVGKKWAEETVLRAAHAFEQTGSYRVPSAPG
ncbi:Amidase [Rubrobacter xylanophilus DSM 9941]|uniref:amidase n=1 Tax=Rubrobacter xylanophilus TaxID=49319 RepID=UPI001C63F7A5|nr:amidase [Rubrobacter xylanophilus]QYJ14974.1 Amidase [Rubrobacter xylanophilus DSM 9941]